MVLDMLRNRPQHCTGLEWKANIWSVAPPSLARGAAARGKRLREVEERDEGKRGKI